MFTVAPHCQIMGQLGLKIPSRKLVAICAISYFFSLYLIFYVVVQTFDVIGGKIFVWELNKALFNLAVRYCVQITFEGDRTVVEMYKFIKKHASIPFKLKRPDSSATKTEKDQSTASTNLRGERSSGTNFKDEL